MRLDQFGSSATLRHSVGNRSCCRSCQLLLGLLLLLPRISDGVNMQQFLQSLDMMRNGCMSKFNVDIAILDRIRDGDFDLEPTKDLMVRGLLKVILWILPIHDYPISAIQSAWPSWRAPSLRRGSWVCLRPLLRCLSFFPQRYRSQPRRHWITARTCVSRESF